MDKVRRAIIIHWEQKASGTGSNRGKPAKDATATKLSAIKRKQPDPTFHSQQRPHGGSSANRGRFKPRGGRGGKNFSKPGQRAHAHFAAIFERGIDPVVDDPEHCHRHSVVPERDEEWPVLGEVLAFRDAVRERVLSTLEEVRKGERPLTRRLVRTLVMMHEHEGFHIEVLTVSSLPLHSVLICQCVTADAFIYAHSARR